MKFRNAMQRFGARLGARFPVVLVGIGASSLASAQGITFDPAPVIAIVDSATTFVTTVGLAVLVFLMVAKGIKWARKAG